MINVSPLSSLKCVPMLEETKIKRSTLGQRNILVVVLIMGTLWTKLKSPFVGKEPDLRHLCEIPDCRYLCQMCYSPDWTGELQFVNLPYVSNEILVCWRCRLDLEEQEELRCPLCLELVYDGKVFQCVNGHTFCSLCEDSMIKCRNRRCPLCAVKRSSVTLNIRNLIAEKAKKRLSEKKNGINASRQKAMIREFHLRGQLLE